MIWAENGGKAQEGRRGIMIDNKGKGLKRMKLQNLGIKKREQSVQRQSEWQLMILH